MSYSAVSIRKPLLSHNPLFRHARATKFNFPVRNMFMRTLYIPSSPEDLRTRTLVPCK